MSSMAITAQVPEKKKESPAPSRGQERAINESGVSVKSQPSKSTKNTKARTTKSTDSKEEKKKKETKSKEAKKPE